MRGPYRLSKTLAERFWAKVDKNGPIHLRLGSACWLWTGTQIPRGYGTIGRGHKGGGKVYAHRLSWEFHFGPAPDGLWVLHRCDNPPCVNPAHLFLGTHQDNMADMTAKGRHGRANARKTHCPQGHEYSPENTRVYLNGRKSPGRMCVTCNKANGSSFYRRAMQTDPAAFRKRNAANKRAERARKRAAREAAKHANLPQVA